MAFVSSTWTWAFFLTTLVQAIVLIALESFIFGKYLDSLKGDARFSRTLPSGAEGVRTIPTYLAVFIFGFLYQLVLVWDALRLKNTIQVIGICLYNLGMLIYASVEVDQVRDAIATLSAGNFIDPRTWDDVHPYLIAAPCIITLGTIVLSWIAWKLYHEFSWTIYKHISADLRMKRRYLTYQIYVALLKFDFFFFIGFTVQFLVVVAYAQLSDSEFGITIAAVPIVIVLLFLAAYFTRIESYIGQTGIIGVLFAALAYFIFKLVRITSPDTEDIYRPIKNSLLTFAVLTLIVLILTIAAAIACMLNFGKGLKPHLQSKKGGAGDAGPEDVKYNDAYNGQAHQLAPVPQRMTID